MSDEESEECTPAITLRRGENGEAGQKSDYHLP